MSAVINDFLRRSLKKVSGKAQPLTVVQGNEGGDMDSIVGSIYLAMLFDKQPKFGFENPVPVLNFASEDFRLRNDVAHLFKELGIDASLLPSVQKGQPSDNFLDLSTVSASLVLHDHNKLRENQSRYATNVVGVVDHHFDEKEYLETTSRLRILRTVGSACTLVSEMYRECGEEVPCPTLLVAPIVLDTVNFEPAQKKVTPADIAAYEWLCGMEGCAARDATAFFEKLVKWKDDVLNLTVPEILRRDYKQFSFKANTSSGLMVVGTSSVPCSCQELESHFTTEVIVKETAAYVKLEKVDVLTFVFSGMVEGRHARGIAFCATPEVLAVFRPFISGSPDGVVFTKISEARLDDGSYVYASYSLSDASVSRKKLAPALSKFLADGTRSFL